MNADPKIAGDMQQARLGSFAKLVVAPALIVMQGVALAADAGIVSYAGKTIENTVPTPHGCQRLERSAGLLHEQVPAGDRYHLFRCATDGQRGVVLRLWRTRILDSKGFPALIVSEGVVRHANSKESRLAIRSCDIEGEAANFAVVVGRYREVPDEIAGKDVVAAWRFVGDEMKMISADRLGRCPI